MNCMCRTLLATVAPAFSSVTASADTIYVPAGGDIIKAINQVSNGDVIQLEAGLYQPYATIDRSQFEDTHRSPHQPAGLKNENRPRHRPRAVFV